MFFRDLTCKRIGIGHLCPEEVRLQFFRRVALTDGAASAKADTAPFFSA